MGSAKKMTGRASSLPAGLAIGAVASVSITVVMTVLLAFLLDREQIHWEVIGYGIIIMVMLSAFAGAVVACSKVKRQRLVVCLLSGAVYFSILLSITALFFGGQFEAIGITALLIAGGCGCAALLEMQQGRAEAVRNTRRRYS